MVIREIDKGISQFIADKNLKVLRRKKDNVAINVSYSQRGLEWTSNKLGRCVMYKRAFIRNGKISCSGNDCLISPDVYVEHFVPRNHTTEAAQTAEYTFIGKAFKLTY